MLLKSILLSAVCLTTGISAFAQLNGPYTIPGATYPTIASAITALNTSGVSGPVTLNIAAGYTETAPVGGFQLGTTALNATLNATNTLTFIKSGAGADPLITAPVGTSTIADNIFALLGTDYVTINGIDLQESAANTSATTAMEEGYALLNLNATAPFDGCNNNTIQNCAITLNRTISTSSKAIYMVHNTVGNTTALTITAAGDLHSNNKFYTNTITNCTNAIYIFGFNAVAPYTLYDQGNDVGGATAATGNTVTNFGGIIYAANIGVYGIYQNNLNVSNNSINQLAGGGVSSIGTTYGIYTVGVNSTFTISNNTLSLSVAPVSTTYGVYGIYNPSAGTTITANNNKITNAEPSGTYSFNYGMYFAGGTNLTISGCRVTQNNTVGATTAQGSTYGIFSTATGAININTDTVTQTTVAGTNAQYYSIVAGGNAVTELLQNNVFLNTNVTSNGTSGFMALLYTSNATPNKTVSGNIVSGTVTHTSTSTAPTYAILFSPATAPAAGTATITGNNMSNITSNGIAFYGIGYLPSVANAQTLVFTNNTFANITGTTAGLYGIDFAPSAASTQNVTITGNTINNFNATTGFIAGIFTSSGSTITVGNNTISNFTTSGANDVYGIYSNGVNTGTANISKNKIYDLQSGGTVALGITVAGGTTTNVSNNLVGNLRSPAGTSATADRVIGINISSTQANSAVNVYYNTIYLAATSTGTDFSTSALFHTANATATTATLDLRNNILVNNSTPNGVGTTAAFRRSATTLGNFAATSDRNLVYGGTPGLVNLLYADGTNAYQTQATYRAGLAPAESNSVTENPPFASTTGTSAAFLHFAPGTTTLAESRGANIAGYPDDFDGNPRQGNPGYTGTGTAPDLGATENNLTATNPLAVTLADFSGRNKGTVNELTWKTVNELSTDGFELERSATGKAFSRIATINAHGKASDYSYADAAPLEGNNYYRLKMVEASGSATYSQTILLNAAAKNGVLSFYPNPVRDMLTLQVPEQNIGSVVQISDVAGRKVWEATATGTALQINMGGYPAGHYFIRIITGNEAQTMGFNKQ